jgi:tetratricopeptide (TPR) repeat protein
MLNTNRLLLCLLFCISLFGNSAFAQSDRQSSTVVDKGEAEKWREDLRYMAKEMPKQHRNLFHTMTREQFEGAIKRLDERIPALSRHQIIIEMARVVAMVGDGHTNIAPTRDPKIGFRVYPIKLYFFQDGLYVRAAAREYAGLVGARVVKIGNAPVEQAYTVVSEIIGHDNEMGVKFFAPHLLVMPEVLHALGLIGDIENAQFIIENRGEQQRVELKPFGAADMMPPDTDLSWMPKVDWVDARGGTRSPTPLWLRDPQNKFWFEYLPDSRTVYAQVNQVGNKDNETVEAFSKRLFAFVDANPVDRFVLDLRLNRGGNGDLNRPLLLGIIKSNKIDQRGRLFTIIGRSTWSAAQSLVNGLEKYTNVLFVGEPTGSKINSYGDSRRITLPNSGITVRVSTLWHQEGDERDKRQWTAPEIAAGLTFEDYRANNDPVLSAVLNYIPKKSLKEVLTEALLANDPKILVKRFGEWKSDPGNAYINAEPRLRRLGYELMAGKSVEQAIEVFKLSVSAFPQSATSYNSLGEAYMVAGNKDLAIKNYEKALDLNPNMSSAIEALKKLRGK